MINPREGQARTPAAVLRATAAPDDAGAETADRFEWQAMMATADVLAAYFHFLDDVGAPIDGNGLVLICEFHEDWALIKDGASEIVSAKHRETVARLGTLRALLDCGVLHLFERWEALGRTPICRVVTTAGLADDAAKVATAGEMLRQSQAAAADGLDALLTAFGALIASVRSNSEVPANDTVALFVASLRIQHSQPRRDHLPYMGPSLYAKPIADRLERPDAAEAIWGAVLGLVRERMRASGRTASGALPTVLGVPLEDDPYASRSLTLADVDTAVRVALRNVAGYARLPRRVRTNRLAVKMAHGGCSDNTIERADTLRLQHQRYWRAAADTPTTEDRRRRLSNTLLQVVAVGADQ